MLNKNWAVSKLTEIRSTYVHEQYATGEEIYLNFSPNHFSVGKWILVYVQWNTLRKQKQHGWVQIVENRFALSVRNGKSIIAIIYIESVKFERTVV